MNFSYLFKEIYRLKTAIQLLYTPQQYAALKYVGRSIPDLYLEKNHRNLLEENDLIEFDIETREKYMK